MIELNNISKTFHPGSVNEVRALNDLNLRMDAGEFLIVVGSNGSGKSTLLNILAGSVFPDAGHFMIDGVDITRLPEHRRGKWIARIFQNPLSGTSPDLSILENFRLAAMRTRHKGFRIGTGASFRNTVRDKISLLNLGLENKTDQAMGTLSGGQRQALTLVMATMDTTKILLLDEPAAALDPRTSGIIMELANKIIRELKLTAVLVTHQLKDVIVYGERVILLREGKIEKDLSGNDKKMLKLNDLFLWFGE